MKDQLERASETGSLIRLERGDTEPGTAMGYVLEVGPEFFLLLLVSDDICYNGFSAMRIDDVTSIELPHRHSSFVEKALILVGGSG